MLGPYGCETRIRRFDNHDDSMHVIRHHHKRIQFHIRKMIREFIPAIAYNPPHLVQLDLAIHDFPKQTFAFPCANRHKMRPGL